jgi:hypothetical protein
MTDQLCSYNLDHSRTPGEMKVRWKIRIATGAEARHLDILQQDAIIALLTWADAQQPRTPKQQPINAEIPESNSGDTIPVHVR